MRSSYDVIVIGSGVGGLETAARLTAAGHSVLVLEKMPVLGGRYATMEYQGFKLSTGAEAVECGGALEEAFDIIGAPFDVQRPNPDIMYRIGEREFELPPGGGGLRRMLSFIGQPGEGDKVMAALKRALSWEEPANGMSLKDWISQYTTDPDILGFFQSFSAAIFTINSDEVTAWTFIRFIKKLGGKIVHAFATHGPSHLMDGMAAKINEKGGEVLKEARVRRILVEDGAVRGVKFEKDGHEVDVTARIVVSNAGPRGTVRLAGPENFDRAYLRLMDTKLRPTPSAGVYIASDRPLMEHPGCLMPIGTRRVCWIVNPTTLCPDLAPKGQHLMLSYNAFGDSTSTSNLDEEIRLNIQDLREMFPDFDSHARVLMAVTFYGDWPIYHAWPGEDMPQKTPIENLYNVGDGVKEAGMIGLESAAETARIVAEDIKARLRRG